MWPSAFPGGDGKRVGRRPGLPEQMDARKRMKAKANLWRSALLAIVLFGSGCGAVDKLVNFGTDTRTETLNALNDAITALQSQSSDWQQVLKDTIGKLTKDAQSTLRSEISNLL